jgi:hypothetical protein
LPIEGFPTDALSSSVDASMPGPIDPTSDPLRFFEFGGGVSLIWAVWVWGSGGGTALLVCVVTGVSDRDTDASVCGLLADIVGSAVLFH